MSSSSARTEQAIARARRTLEQRREARAASLAPAPAAAATPPVALEITNATVNPLRSEAGQERLLKPSVSLSYAEDGGIEMLGTNRLRSGFVVQTPSENLYAFSLFANHPTDFPLSSWCVRDNTAPLQNATSSDTLASTTHFLVDVYTLIYLTQGLRLDSQRLFLGRRTHTHGTQCVRGGGDAAVCSLEEEVKINSIFWSYAPRTDERWKAHFEVLSETQRACSEVLRQHYDNAIATLVRTIGGSSTTTPEPPPSSPRTDDSDATPHVDDVAALADTLTSVVGLHDSGQSLSTSE